MALPPGCTVAMLPGCHPDRNPPAPACSRCGKEWVSLRWRAVKFAKGGEGWEKFCETCLDEIGWDNDSPSPAA